MATTTKWVTPEAITTILSTEMNSLSNGAYTAAGSTVDNLTDLYQYGEFELALASITTGSGAPYCALYLVKQIDGTNYEDGGGSVAPPATALLATFPLRASVTGAQRVIVGNLLLPPAVFKPVLLDQSGVALAASGSTLKLRRYNEQSV